MKNYRHKKSKHMYLVDPPPLTAQRRTPLADALRSLTARGKLEESLVSPDHHHIKSALYRPDGNFYINKEPWEKECWKFILESDALNSARLTVHLEPFGPRGGDDCYFSTSTCSSTRCFPCNEREREVRERNRQTLWRVFSPEWIRLNRPHEIQI